MQICARQLQRLKDGSMHKWNMEVGIWKLENIILCMTFSLPSSSFYLLSSELRCGRLVHNLRMTTRTTSRFVPSPTNCIHFVRSLWLTTRRFTRLMRVTYPPKILDSTSVSYVLYTLPTALTTRTTFI